MSTTRLLVVNSASNAISFLIVGVVNLLVVAMLIREYGVGGYGIYVICRMLMPSGVVSVFDFGLPETVTRYVAFHEENPKKFIQVFLSGLIGFVLVGCIAYLLLSLFYDSFIEMVKVSTVDEKDSLATGVSYVILAVLPFFIGVFFESVLKGFQKFVLIRLTEVIAVLVFLVLLYLGIGRGISIDEVVVMYLIIYISRYVLLLIYFLYSYRALVISQFSFSFMLFKEFFLHARTVFAGKFFSLLTNNFPLLLLTTIADASAVGVYDAVMRLPRFAKSVMGQVNAVLIPYVAKLSNTAERSSISVTLLAGSKAQIFIFGPPLLCACLFAQEIVTYWLGNELVEYSWALTLMFIWAFIVTFVGVGGTIAVTERALLKQINLVSVLQLVLLLIMAVIFVYLFGVAGVFTAFFVSSLLTVPMGIKCIAKFYAVPQADLYMPGILIFAISMMIGGSIISLNLSEGMFGLFLSGSFSLLSIWVVSFLSVFSSEERSWIANKAGEYLR